MYDMFYYENIVRMLLPNDADVIVSKGSHQPFIHGLDIDGDGEREIVAAYREGAQAYFVVIKQYDNQWLIADQVKGKAANISYFKTAPITDKNTSNLVVGWQLGPMWSDLSIYQWQQGKLVDLVTGNTSFTNIEVNGFHDGTDKNRTYKIALWTHDTGDAYQVDIYRWGDGRLVPAKEIYPRYFQKVVNYYKKLTEEFSDSSLYWYYLADAQYQANMREEAIASVNIAKSLDRPYPSVEVLQALSEQLEDISLFPANPRTVSGTKWGYIDQNGQFVIEPQYDFAEEFQENRLAVVGQSGKSGVINKQGIFVIRPIYDSISQFFQGRATVIDSKGFAVIDEAGNVITPRRYDYIGNYSDARAVFSRTDKQGQSRYGYLDLKGKEIIQAKFVSAGDFRDGKAVVQVANQEFALINQQGEILHRYKQANVGSLGDGLLAFQASQGGKYGYIDESGKVVLVPQYVWAQPFTDGRAIVSITKDETDFVGVIDRTGKYIVPPDYNDVLDLREGRLAVGKAIDPTQPYIGSIYALVDANGNVLTPFQFLEILEYHQGVASVTDGKHTYFIDKDGKEVRNLPKVVGKGVLSLLDAGNVIRVVVDMRTSYRKPTGEIIWEQNTVIPLRTPYKVVEQKYHPNSDRLIYYPEIEGMRDLPSQREVNETLKNRSIAMAGNPEEAEEYSYSGDFAIEFFRKNLLVLELSGYQYAFGAAHGLPSKQYPHIDLVTGKFYELSDLFKPESDYVKVLSDIIARQIQTDPQYSYVFPDTYQGITANQPFYVTGDALYIFFAPYDIAPFAAGFPTFRIPYSEIEGMINKQGEFWRSFH